MVQSIIKRLAHRNANVQLYTLEVRPRPVSMVLHSMLLMVPGDGILTISSVCCRLHMRFARIAARMSIAKCPAER